jgi:hypothetical protein
MPSSFASCFLSKLIASSSFSTEEKFEFFHTAIENMDSEVLHQHQQLYEQLFHVLYFPSTVQSIDICRRFSKFIYAMSRNEILLLSNLSITFPPFLAIIHSFSLHDVEIKSFSNYFTCMTSSVMKEVVLKNSDQQPLSPLPSILSSDISILHLQLSTSSNNSCKLYSNNIAMWGQFKGVFIEDGIMYPLHFVHGNTTVEKMAECKSNILTTSKHSIQLWHSKENQVYESLSTYKIYSSDRIDAIQFSSSAERFICAGNSYIQLFDCQRLMPLRMISSHQHSIHTLQYIDENVIASSSNKNIITWDLRCSSIVDIFESKNNLISSDWSKNHLTMACGYDNGIVQTWDHRFHRLQMNVKTGSVQYLKFHADLPSLAVITGEDIHVIDVHQNASLYSQPFTNAKDIQQMFFDKNQLILF